jgi:ribosomal-protein-alanine N-acetyltransferase
VKAPHEIRTARLLLRPIEERDAGAIFEGWCQDPEALRYLTWPRQASSNETLQLVRSAMDAWSRGVAFAYVAVQPDNGVLVGYLKMTLEQPWRLALGWIVARPYWGQGFATEMVRSVLAWGHQQTDLYRIWAMTHRDHAAAVRVMEKAGMLREGILRRWLVFPHLSPEPQDVVCYSVAR